jgi:hypothetical protein
MLDWTLPETRKMWATRLLALRTRREALLLAQGLAESQFATHPELRKLWTSAKEWRAVPQRVFKETAVFAGDPTQASVVFQTSGTTIGQSGTHYLWDDRIYREVSLEGAKRAGLFVSPVTPQFLAPTPEASPHSSLSRMFGYWSEAFGGKASRFWVNDGELRTTDLREQLEKHIAKNEPVALAGTAFSFVHWLDAFPCQPLKLPRGSWILETGGFKGRSRVLAKPQLYRELARAFGVADRNIWNEYGMTELCSQAYARGTRGTHRTPAWAWVRVIDPETGHEVEVGETGIVEWVDLANTDSALSVRTQDAAIRLSKGFRLLGRVSEVDLRGCSLTAETWRRK